LYLEKRVSYRRLKKEFGLDDETIDDVRHELIVKRLAVDEGGQGLTFVGAALFEASIARPRHLHRPPCRWVRPRPPRRPRSHRRRPRPSAAS